MHDTIHTTGRRAPRRAARHAAHASLAAIALAALMPAAALAQTAADTRAAVRTAYFDVVAGEARLALLDEIHGLAVRAREAAQERFAAGRSPRLEVLQADLAAAQAENDQIAARAETTAARTTLNALLAWPLETVAPLATALQHFQLIYLVGSLFVATAFQPFIWMAIALLVYFGYGMTHSRLDENSRF